ncbi:MAG: hypothetical protein IT336_07905 [Thermomicrobiales bacterium]|nr:hypothetical protein [Thermomicrobiales bacterium]
MNALSLLLVETGDLVTAHRVVNDALDAFGRLGMLEGLASTLSAAASLALASGNTQRAAGLLGASAGIAARIEFRFPMLEATRQEQTRGRLSELLGNAFAEIERAGRSLTPSQAIALARAIDDAPDATSSLARPAGLTAREIEVLVLLVEGKSDREIGESLSISRSTAARHVANIFNKLDVNSRTAAAAYAFRAGIVAR